MDRSVAPAGAQREGSVVARPGGEDGWYVDDRCTNCDVARQFALGLIGEVDGRSAVLRRPYGEAETGQMYAAAFLPPMTAPTHGLRQETLTPPELIS
ncbi:hypothetical protein [Streptosporangium sp. NPDC004631]